MALVALRTSLHDPTGQEGTSRGLAWQCWVCRLQHSLSPSASSVPHIPCPNTKQPLVWLSCLQAAWRPAAAGARPLLSRAFATDEPLKDPRTTSAQQRAHETDEATKDSVRGRGGACTMRGQARVSKGAASQLGEAGVAGAGGSRRDAGCMHTHTLAHTTPHLRSAPTTPPPHPPPPTPADPPRCHGPAGRGCQGHWGDGQERSPGCQGERQADVSGSPACCIFPCSEWSGMGQGGEGRRLKSDPRTESGVQGIGSQPHRTPASIGGRAGCCSVQQPCDLLMVCALTTPPSLPFPSCRYDSVKEKGECGLCVCWGWQGGLWDGWVGVGGGGPGADRQKKGWGGWGPASSLKHGELAG